MKKRFFLSLLIFIFLCALIPSDGFCSLQKKVSLKNDLVAPVVLEADNVEFDEELGLAVAEGHAVLRYLQIVLRADRITLDSDTNIVKAYAAEGKRITIKQGNTDNLVGTFIEYHLNDLTGFMDAPDGNTKVENGTLFAKSSQLEFAPPAIAHDRQWIHGKWLKKARPDDTVIKWNDASYTTCLQENPHYLLRSKKISMLPGRYIILHQPRVYIGPRYLFTLPINMLVNQRRKRRVIISVLPNYDDDKHAGIEARSRILWDTGSLDLKVGSWAAGITEYRVRLDQHITDWLSVYGGSSRSYDDDLGETKERPYWGTVLSKDGWRMETGWSQREKRSVVRRPGQKEYETTLWRDPEIKLTSPWLGLHTGSLSQYTRAKGNWGRYEETGSNSDAHTGFIERYGWGVDYYTDYPFRFGSWRISPFIKGYYWNYGYKNDDSDRQIITKLIYGIRASSGILELGSAYEQRRVSGKTAFRRGWDSYDDENTFYQRVGVKLGKNFTFSVQGIWEMTHGDAHDLTSVAYILSYNNKCCSTWTLTYNDDCTKRDSENWVTFSIAINAFPDTKYKFGSHHVTNPFTRPVPPREKGEELTMMETSGRDSLEDYEMEIPDFDI